jgi:hypothetical protein
VAGTLPQTKLTGGFARGAAIERLAACLTTDEIEDVVEDIEALLDLLEQTVARR